MALAYAPWMAAYTETVEAKNPALVATGLALWGWILRLVVGISFIFLPIVITSVSKVVDNQPAATAVCYPQPHPSRCVSTTVAKSHHVKHGQTITTFIATHPKSIAFASAHAKLLAKLSAHGTAVAAVAASPTPANIAAAEKALGPKDFGLLVKYAAQLKTLVQPYTVQLDYVAAHQKALTQLSDGIQHSPGQWQTWFWIDLGGMVVFLPSIWLTRGRWSPGRARRDAAEHDEMVAAELRRISDRRAGGGGEGATT